MTTYNVIVQVDSEGPSITWGPIGGTTSGAAYELSPGDVVNFKRVGFGTTVISSFKSGFWTNTSDITLTASNQSKTVSSGTVADIDGLTASFDAINVTRYFKMGGALPDLEIDDIDDILLPNGSTSHDITIANATNTTTYEIRTGSSTGTVVATASSSSPNGTLTVNNAPAAGNSRTYFVTGRRSLANGGSDTISLILAYGVTHSSPGSSVGDGGSSTYGLIINDADGDVVLDVSDRVIVFSDYVTGTLSTTELTKTITLAKQGTTVIDMAPASVVISGGVAQRQHILHTTISGTTLTIERTSTTGSLYGLPADGETTSYNFLIVYDPEAV
jgi:hypothetical protein